MYMHEHLDMWETYLHYKQAKEGISKTVSAVMEQGHREVIVKPQMKILREGVWLIRFLDFGKHSTVLLSTNMH
jgi:ATP-dependent Lon protease